MGLLAKIAQMLRPTVKVAKELPPGFTMREFGPTEREAIDEIIGPLRAVGSKVNPDDRDIFTMMRNTFKVNPEARTRFIFTPEGQVAGGYQVAPREKSMYIPNVAVAEQGQGYGRMLMEDAMRNREGPTFLVSAPGKEGFYRKMGMREQIDPDTDVSSFSFRRGGLVQACECGCKGRR